MQPSLMMSSHLVPAFASGAESLRAGGCRCECPRASHSSSPNSLSPLICAHASGTRARFRAFSSRPGPRRLAEAALGALRLAAPRPGARCAPRGGAVLQGALVGALGAGARRSPPPPRTLHACSSAGRDWWTGAGQARWGGTGFQFGWYSAYIHIHTQVSTTCTTCHPPKRQTP